MPNGLARTSFFARRRNRARRAVTLLEVLLAVGIGALVSAGAAYQLNERSLDLKAKAAADQLSIVSQAAESYIKNNSQTVSGLVPASGNTASIPLSTIIAAGYLTGLSTSYDTTPYDGGYEIWVRGTGGGGYQAMVAVTGGEDPGRARLAEIAQQTKLNTGVVINPPYPQADANLIRGLFGGWQANVSDFTGGSPTTWLATLLAVHDDIAGNDFLYRGAIPGRPDLNQMRTDITMTLDSGITWKDPRTGKEMDIHLDQNGTDSSQMLIVDGDTPTTGVLFQNNDPTNPNPIQIQIKHDANGDPNYDGSTITINSTLASNTAAANSAGYGAGNPYNLYVDGKTNITGDTRIGQNLNVGGDTNIEGNTTMQGNATVNGNTILGNTAGDTLTVNATAFFNENATFRKDVHIQGNLTLDKCLAMGGASNDPNYCLNVGNGGRPFAAHFLDTVEIEGGAFGGNPDVALWADGDIIANSSNVRALAYFYQSDRRYKDNIQKLDEGQLEKLLEIEGVTYNWKSDGRKDYGVIAQDVEKVFPELVHTDGNGLKSVEYGNLIAPTIEALRELKSQNDALKAEVDQLKKDGTK